MRLPENTIYRKAFAAREWHFDEDCLYWPKEHFVRYQGPTEPDALCGECELRDRSYKVGEASEFFLSAGRRAEVAIGERIFVERESAPGFLSRRAPIYFLLGGQVDMFVGSRKVGSVGPGEVFGEAELIAGAPRSASAIAARTSQIVVLQGDEFQRALKRRPGFALGLLGLMAARVRLAAAEIRLQESYCDACVATSNNFVGGKLLRELLERYGDRALLKLDANAIILREGSIGALVYVVVKGRVDILIANQLVETIGPGGVFGEMAVYTGQTRSASALAQSDCTLLTLSERDFVALLYSSPEFVMALLRALAERLRLMTASRQPKAA